MKLSIVHGLAGLAVLLAATAPASADANSRRQQIRTACASDYKRFCMTVMPGGGRLLACLSQHAAELSQPCAAVVGVTMQCADDYKKFCSTASPGNGEVKRCLQEHLSNLSTGCARLISASLRAK
jgi:hypothetical protein